MLLLFAVQHITPFGDITFLKKDFYQQYTPFFYEFHRKIRSGHSLSYSFNAGIGANFFAISVYYLASPFNLLGLLFPESLILEFMSYMVVLKTGLCGLTCSHYLRLHFSCTDFAIPFFACAYAMSGFMAAYNWNVMWMDVLFLTPLAILGMERIAEGGSPVLYAISLSASIYSNYYLSIMLCIFLALYFLTLSAIKRPRTSSVISFAWFSLLSGAIGAVMILPEAAALSFTTFSNAAFPKSPGFFMSPLDLFARHLLGVTTETGLEHWPNIYCGLIFFLLLPLYMFSKKVPLRQKIFKLILILFLLISFNSNVLEYLWHGFNYPDSLPARQSFLYIFLLISLGYEGFLSVRGMEADSFAISILSGLSLGILSAIFTHDDAVTASSLSLSAAFALAFVFILYLYRRSPSEKDFPGNIEKFVYRFIICSLLLTELCVNMYFTGSRSIPRSDYFSRYDDYKLLSDVIRTRNTNFKEPLSRTDEYSRNIRNHSMMLNFSSLSCFSSTTNGLITRYAERHGLMNSRVFYLSDGSTPIGKCFLGQHYSLLPANSLTSSEELLSPLKFSNGAVLYQHLYTLPNAYMLHNCDTALFTNVSKSSSIIDGSLTLSERWMEPADYENKLVNSMGSALTVFSPWENAYQTGDGFRIDFDTSAHLYAYNKNRTETDLIVRFSDGSENKIFNSQKNRYNLDLGYHKAGTYALISYLPADDGKLPEKDFSLSVWALNQEALQAFTKLINRNEKPELDSTGDARLNGRISVNSDGMLVISLPYEPGWTLTVDGKEEEIQLFDGLFISFPLESGEHDVELCFTPPLFYQGLVISLLSAIMMAISLRFHRHWALLDSFRRRFPEYLPSADRNT